MALARSSTSSLSPYGTVLRNRSLRTQQNDRFANLKRGSIRGLQSILSPHGGYSPYGTTNDGRASPAPSFATSHEVSLSSSALAYNLLTRSSKGGTRIDGLVPRTDAWIRIQLVTHDH